MARVADGWISAALPHGVTYERFAAVKDAAEESGRDPESIELIVRANAVLVAEPLGGDRPVFTGSVDQLAADVEATREIGAAELCVDVTFDPEVNATGEFLGRLELFHELMTGPAFGHS